MQNYLKLFEIQSRDICTLTPTKRPLSTFVCIEIQHDSKSRTTVALMPNFKIQNPLTDIPLHCKLDNQSWFLPCFTPFIRVVKSSQLPVKIAAYLVSIGWLLCLAFIYGWCFLCLPLTLTTQPSTSKLSNNPALYDSLKDQHLIKTDSFFLSQKSPS